jgi:hypothetical protein
VVRPASSRGSNSATPVCQNTHSVAPPLLRTRARLLWRSRFSMLNDRISLARAADSYSSRQKARSRSATSLRRHKDAICSRVRALVRSTETLGRSSRAVGSVLSQPRRPPEGAGGAQDSELTETRGRRRLGIAPLEPAGELFRHPRLVEHAQQGVGTDVALQHAEGVSVNPLRTGPELVLGKRPAVYRVLPSAVDPRARGDLVVRRAP